MNRPTPSQLVLRPESTVYDPSDERWLGQVQALLAELGQQVGPVRKEVTPIAGKKGGATDIILALGSAGAFTTAVTLFSLWLKRDKSRVISVEAEVNGVKKVVKVTGENLSEEMIREVFAGAVK